MRPFLLVFATAAIVTALTVPIVGWAGRRAGLVDRPADPRKVHTEPVPTMGGLGMLAGFLAAMAVAWRLDAFRDLFRATSEPLGLVIGVLVIAALGVLDDVRGLPPTVKLAGQIVAALGPVLFGIQIVYAWVPGLEVVALGPDLGLPLTVVAMIAMINAVNLIDGLDGLAAGVVGIAGVAFFVFAYLSGSSGIAEAVPSSAALVAAALAGMCLGFLLYNFHPARIFMGDTGSMMLGLLLASAGVSYVGRTTVPSYGDFAGSLPLLIPAFLLAIPLVDTAFAVARRAYRRQPIAMADKGHLHHLLIAFGHSHRRAVLTLYFWSAAMAFGTVGFSFLDTGLMVALLALLVVVGLVITAVGIRHSRDEVLAPSQEAVRQRDIG